MKDIVDRSIDRSVASAELNNSAAVGVSLPSSRSNQGGDSIWRVDFLAPAIDRPRTQSESIMVTSGPTEGNVT